MGTRYTATSITSYNSAPPPDDGSTGSDNIVSWSGVKTKLGDPVKTALESIDSKLTAFVDIGPSAKTANYTTVAGDHLKTLECTNTITVSLLDAATAGAGYTVGVFNAGVGTVTIGRATGANTINGSAADITIAPKTGVTVRVIAAASGYVTIDSAIPALATLTSAADKGIQFTGAGTAATYDLTAAGKALLDDADAAAQRTTLGLGTAATKNTGTSGNTVPLLDAANTWSAAQNISRVFTPSASGGDKGADTINASEYYRNGTAVLDLRVSQATTSGTAFDFTGITASAKRITVIFQGVSLSGTEGLLVQLGTAAGFVTTGYISTSGRESHGNTSFISSSTTGFLVFTSSATDLFSGHMVLTHHGGNVWVASLVGKRATDQTVIGAGDITLAGVLTQIRITRTGTNTFDAGSVSILVE